MSHNIDRTSSFSARHACLSMLVVALTAVTFAEVAEARPGRVTQVPNNDFSCGLCHAGGGTGPRNAFGLDVQATLTTPGAAGQVQWSEIFDLDSDGDGCTNGQELGDPNGEWTIGDPNPDGTVSNPADADSSQECNVMNNAPNNAPNNEPGDNNEPNNAPNNEPGDNNTPNNTPNNDPNNAPNNDPNNDPNNAPNNDPNNGENNGGNNDPNNDAPNNDGGDGDGGGDNAGDGDGGDEGCATTPGGGTSGWGFLMAMAAWMFLRRRDERA